MYAYVVCVCVCMCVTCVCVCVCMLLLLVCRKVVSASVIWLKPRRVIKFLEKDLGESVIFVSQMITLSGGHSKGNHPLPFYFYVCVYVYIIMLYTERANK